MKSTKENLPQQQDSEVENIHQFSLKPINTQTCHLTAVTVDFSPQTSENQEVSITPRLNKSKDSFQPLFENPYIRNILFGNRQIPQKFLFFKQGPIGSPFSIRSFQYKNEGSKPRPTSKFCQLCKQKFSQDYLDHIKHIVHLNNLKANPFQRYIQTLLQDFKIKLNPKRTFETSLKEENLPSKNKKKVKEEQKTLRIDSLKLDFPLKTVDSTENTNNSSALDQKQKKQTLNSLKE